MIWCIEYFTRDLSIEEHLNDLSNKLSKFRLLYKSRWAIFWSDSIQNCQIYATAEKIQ